jgi:probable phosphoglycerate mutase
MKTVVLVRHGETASNSYKITGKPDDPLSAQGLIESSLIAERLSDSSVEIIISSPYRRTRQTAEVIATATNQKMIFSTLFVESRNPTEIEGLSMSDPDVLSVRTTIKDHWGEWNWHYSNEENYWDLLDRSQLSLEFLASRPENNIIVVTHGAFMRMLIQTALLQEALTPKLSTILFFGLGIDNTGISVMQWDSAQKWRLVRWNDTAHVLANPFQVQGL